MDGSLTLAAPAAAGTPAFDPSEMRSAGLRRRLQEWLFDRLPLAYPLLRTAMRSVRIGRTVIVSRRDDVEAVLDNCEAFHSRSGMRIGQLQEAAGIAFPPPVLGLRSDEPGVYDATMRTVARAIRLDDVGRVAAVVGGFVAPQVAQTGTIDAGPLFLRASAYLARDYFGLRAADSELHELALCCLSLVAYAFGPDRIDTATGRLGVAAAARISHTLRRSIAWRGGHSDTVIGRLLADGMTELEVELMLTVLMMALVAVPAAASINVLRLLLQRPEAMRLARAAAVAGDDTALGRCTVEALRLNPGLLGLFRACHKDTVIGAGSWRSVRARVGDTVLSLTHSAMLDGSRVRAPRDFDPDRPAADTLGFGFGRHLCVGFAIGRAQLTHALKPLLCRGVSQTGADRAAVSYFGTVPEHFPVRLG